MEQKPTVALSQFLCRKQQIFEERTQIKVLAGNVNKKVVGKEQTEAK